MLQEYEIFIDYKEYSLEIGIYITAFDYDKKRRYVAKPVELIMEPLEEGGLAPVPTIRLSGVGDRTKDGKSLFLESLVKALEKSGYAVKYAEETAGELKATKYHLEDMRKLNKLLAPKN